MIEHLSSEPYSVSFWWNIPADSVDSLKFTKGKRLLRTK